MLPPKPNANRATSEMAPKTMSAKSAQLNGVKSFAWIGANSGWPKAGDGSACRLARMDALRFKNA